MNAPDLAPKTCPRCGRSAHFSYANAAEAAKQSPLCWGHDESDCPGMTAGAAKLQEPAIGDAFTDKDGDRWELVADATDRRGRFLLFAVRHHCDVLGCEEWPLTDAKLEPGQWAEAVETWQLVPVKPTSPQGAAT